MRIMAHDGSVLSVEGGDMAIIETLKAAKMFGHEEFVYTGNSSSGQNSHNDMQEAFLREAGLWDDEDLEEATWNNNELLMNLPSSTGIYVLSGNGKTLHFHVQQRKGEGHGQFGYTWRAEYRIISVG